MQDQGTSQTPNVSAAETYAGKRKRLLYYQHLRSLLLTISGPSDSICDGGSHDVDMISFLPCEKKYSIDVRYPLSAEGVEGIKGNYLDHDFEGLDIITCFQVLEHIDDDMVGAFAQKLLSDARIAVISVPYMWPKGKCKWHKQDPVDVDKIIEWFGKNPVFLHVVTERWGNSRIIAVFVQGQNPEIDLEYWRKDAEAAQDAYNKLKQERERKRKPKSKRLIGRFKSKLRPRKADEKD